MAEHVGGTPREAHAVEPPDLEAALTVRRELGPDSEPALVESFAEKIEAGVLVAWTGLATVNVAHAWQGRQRR